MARGYLEKILLVDLSTGRLDIDTVSDKIYRDFIGGYGLGAHFLFHHQKAGVNALGPENILGFLTGPLTGTPALGGSRYVVVSKSPLTGGWGDANSGGYFGPHLKFAGYDAIFFTGIAPEPVYLFINSGKIELRNASQLWGKDCFETENILRAELGNDVEVACIGPSGEKLALISAVINNKGRAAARSGLGAVMGSKKLKAIAVKGNIKVPLNDAIQTAELRKKLIPQLTGGIAQMLKKYGTTGFYKNSSIVGDTPTKNWGGTSIIDFPDFELLAAENIGELQEHKYACFQCPIGCGGRMKEGIGNYKWEAGIHRPEYETLAMFGNMCLNGNLESIIKANDICNQYGLDTISAGAVIAFTIDCYEHGVINKSDTDGVEMTWGNYQAIVDMTQKMAKREGFGNLLADGVKEAAKKIGNGADKYAIHIQGQEPPGHDPKLGIHYGISYRFDPTPARHTQGGAAHPPGVMPTYNRMSFTDRGKPHKIGTSFNHFMNCSGECFLVYFNLPHIDAFIETMKAVTGWDLTFEEILKTGERIANIRQAFNIREGLNPVQFERHGRLVGKPPQSEGPLKGMTIDEETLKIDYLSAMDWDIKTAKPSKEKLLELGLDDVADELYSGER